jgi:nicotinic acid mononucleotide adenylyltransferase
MKIAFAGSATNPSHLGHAQVLQLMLQDLFDVVIWYPSGFSREKPNLLDGIHRQQLAHLAFPQSWVYRPRPGWAKLLLDLAATMAADVPTATRFYLLQEQYKDAEITFVTGSDGVTPGKDGILPIQTWNNYYPDPNSEQCTAINPLTGEEIEIIPLNQHQIKIIPRQGFVIPGQVDLPDHISWLTDEVLPDIRSSSIRVLVAKGDKSWRKLVNEQVEQYIDLHQLYQDKE